MRLLTGAGTPREFQARISAYLAAAITPTGGLVILLVIAATAGTPSLAASSSTAAERRLRQRAVKQVIGDGLRSRTDQRRATEVDIAVHALNRMLELGRPESVRIA